MNTKPFGLIGFLVVVGIICVSVSAAHASRRTTVTAPPTTPPVVNEDAPIVSSP